MKNGKLHTAFFIIHFREKNEPSANNRHDNQTMVAFKERMPSSVTYAASAKCIAIISRSAKGNCSNVATARDL